MKEWSVVDSRRKGFCCELRIREKGILQYAFGQISLRLGTLGYRLSRVSLSEKRKTGLLQGPEY